MLNRFHSSSRLIRPSGSFMVTIPIEVVRAFDIKEGDKEGVDRTPAQKDQYEVVRKERIA